MESKRRTMVKAGLWSLIGWLVMAVVGYLATGSMAVGGTMAATNTIIGFVIYIFYERIWARVTWGRADA